ncbi:filaggrin-2-like [Pollicipes pollicipes]|uniref:filaggrin-2-like n=1 Tax=Pollicipes pollicipes TaxID=41117 RepID=UPI001884F47A|nr:filaggrin-2-like [Pollicipes pollicipes]
MCQVEAKDFQATVTSTAYRVLKGVCNPAELESHLRLMEERLYQKLEEMKETMMIIMRQTNSDFQRCNDVPSGGQVPHPDSKNGAAWTAASETRKQHAAARGYSASPDPKHDKFGAPQNDFAVSPLPEGSDRRRLAAQSLLSRHPPIMTADSFRERSSSLGERRGSGSGSDSGSRPGSGPGSSSGPAGGGYTAAAVQPRWTRGDSAHSQPSTTGAATSRAGGAGRQASSSQHTERGGHHLSTSHRPVSPPQSSGRKWPPTSLQSLSPKPSRAGHQAKTRDGHQGRGQHRTGAGHAGRGQHHAEHQAKTRDGHQGRGQHRTGAGHSSRGQHHAGVRQPGRGRHVTDTISFVPSAQGAPASRYSELGAYNDTVYYMNGKRMYSYYWKIEDFGLKMATWKSDHALRSASFYVYHGGYRMFLRLYPRHRGASVLVRAGLTSGRNDASLAWPFRLPFRVSLLDHSAPPADLQSRVWSPAREPVPHRLLARRRALLEDALLVKLDVFLDEEGDSRARNGWSR